MLGMQGGFTKHCCSYAFGIAVTLRNTTRNATGLFVLVMSLEGAVSRIATCTASEDLSATSPYKAWLGEEFREGNG